jgi:hypothetical protein
MTAISFRAKRVKKPNRKDWEELRHMVLYLVSTKLMPLILSVDGSNNLYWYADSSRHGAGLTLRRVFTINISSAQKLNMGSCSG